MLIMLCLCFTAATYGQKKKKSTSKTASAKHHTTASSKKGHSSGSKSSKGRKSSSKGKHGKKHHFRDEPPEGELIIHQDQSDINWVFGDEALTFQVPTSYLRTHAYIRNTTKNQLSFSVYQDGRWVDAGLPAMANSDYSVAESGRFKMAVNGRALELPLYPGHFYHITANPDGSVNDIVDATETVMVK